MRHHRQCQHCRAAVCSYVHGQPKTHFAYVCMDCNGHIRCATMDAGVGVRPGGSAEHVGAVRVSHGLCAACEEQRMKEIAQ